MDKYSTTIENLSVGYTDIVVSDVNVNIAPGEILAIIGPNGAGKSTILKTITKQIKKKNGKIYIAGKDDNNIPAKELAKRLSMVMTTRIHPELMSCREVIASGRYPYTGRLGILSDKDNSIVDRIISLMNIENIKDKDFLKISDGQRQRVMIARALAQEPEIMILDEPTSYLDIMYKLEILSIIKGLSKTNNITMIMTMHELEFVPAIADKVMAVSDGKVLEIGSPKDVFSGDKLEQIYHLKKGTGNIMSDGLWQYSKGIEESLKCQK
ncbi:MAG: ABC transporter ATP-binding protein [Butyrivibrio sp.]|nr:ABC transporter ATP-binding protein [Butyrivibrio sp.]